MSDLMDTVVQTAHDSNILRFYPNALVQVLVAGTATLVAEVTADDKGNFSVDSLATGKYDIKVDGQLRRTLHHVKADHSHPADETWKFFKSGAITADQGEVSTMEICGSMVAGVIRRVTVGVQNVDAAGDTTVHLLKGQSGQSAALTIASDSVWSHRVYPGAAKKRYLYSPTNPNISLLAGECVTLGIDYAAGTVEGLTVIVVFRPNA